MSAVIENIRLAIVEMSILEIIAFITAIIYVVLAARENVWCWPFGIVSSFLSIILFAKIQLYAESFLYLFYVGFGIYGWVLWHNSQKNKQNNEELKIKEWGFPTHLVVVFIGVGFSLIVFFLLSWFTNEAKPLIDAFTTTFAIITTFMVTRKILSNWIYWVVIDVVSVYLYIDRGYYLYGVLMVAYTILAVVGFVAWLKKYKNQKAINYD